MCKPPGQRAGAWPIDLHVELTRTHNLLRLGDEGGRLASKCHGTVENQHHNGGTVGMLNFRNNDPMFFCG